MEKIVEPCPQCKENSWSTVIANYAWQCHTCGYIREENFWKEPDPKEWVREQGSKESQGIETPPAPRYKKTDDGQLRCECLYRGNALYTLCKSHNFGLEVAKKLQIGMALGWAAKQQEEKAKAAPPQPKDPFPIERVSTSESVQVELITPGENEKPTTES